ncbi:glycosyltransferase family 4 protein [uncultured Pseudodesulfovibrio sp.]|uniref:glycosyltransferase family 4 protein n=1 Tax=uncultured Pseudodesulfovibrio sp. TaxID=2035858 RepID=UPI0029C74F2D|nr:glycosyltransferase family 4 protein [uncultured Pseudodesulfovibrio sp.]
MKVLVVDEELPWPLNTGKRLRTYNLLLRMQREHELHLVCHGEADTLPGCPNVVVHPVASPVVAQHGAKFYSALLANLWSPDPYVVQRHSSKGMRKTIADLVASEAFDLVHCEWTPYTVNLLEVLEAYPSVLSTHNVEALIWKRLWEREPNPLKKSYIWLQWKKMEKYEARAVHLYDKVMCVSDEDKQCIVGEFDCPHVTVVPNGVDEQYFAPDAGDEMKNSMVFTGSMDWRPNQDAVNYFVNDIFPLIREALPTASFTIVGRFPPEDMTRKWQRVEGVTVTGTVDDVRTYIARSSLYVVPLRIGGGSRLKILEALSMRKRVLSTTVGAEGLKLDSGQHLMLEDSAEGFARMAVNMLSSPSEFEHLADNGMQRVLSMYTWDSIATVMNDVWMRARESRAHAS